MTKDLRNPARIDGSTPQGELVAAHWTRLSLTVESAMQALQKQGIAPGQATASDLHGMDMLHMGGLTATDTLAEMAGIRPGRQVLDVGAGVGGPARRMTHKYGANVWDVELGESIQQTAVARTTLVGLEGQVHFKRASTLALPFPDGQFDVVVMQHVAMQVAEMDQLFGEAARVLNGSGVLALHEIFAGEGGPPLFPLAWATGPAMSFLEMVDECERRLARVGLKAGEFLDRSEEGRQYHLANIKTMQHALGHAEGTQGRSVEATRVRLETATSMERNLRERRLKVGMIAYRKARDIAAT